MSTRATTGAATGGTHGVYETGPYGILTLCGQIGDTPMRPGTITCGHCEEVAARDTAGVWFSDTAYLRTYRVPAAGN